MISPRYITLLLALTLATTRGGELSIDSNAPAGQKLPTPFEIETLSPLDPSPAEYPPLVFFRLINRSDRQVDIGGLTLAEFDIEITDPAGKTVRRPLDRSMQNGFIPQYLLAPDQGKWFIAGLSRKPAGVYRVRVLPADPAGMAKSDLPFRRFLHVPVSPTMATLRIDNTPATLEKWLGDVRQRLQGLDPYLCRWSLTQQIDPLHDELLDMLTEVTSERSAYAAWAFRTTWRPRPDPALDRALANALAAEEALPSARRTERSDAGLMHLVQEEPRPAFLDVVIRWSRPGGSHARDAALMALQSYRNDPKAVEAVAAMLDDPNNDRFAAELLCTWRRDDRALPVLEKYAFMTDGVISQPYIFWHQIIKYGRRPGAIAIIERGLRDPRPEIVAEAKAAFAKLPPEPGAGH